VESHLNQSIAFKIRKVGRYVTLFGPSRTLVKIKGQYHLNRTQGLDTPVWNNPGCASPDDPDRFVGLIGCGNFPYCNVGFFLKKTAPNFLRATYDLMPARSRSLCADYGGAYATDDVKAMMDDPKVKLLYISSNHASHAEYAIQGLDAGKHVHIEKPHVVTQEQLRRLGEAQKRNPDKMIFLGFNRPRSSLFQRVQAALGGQSGPLMINWFIAGHKIPDDHWYYSDAEGGRILGNLCHWTDLTLHMVGFENAFPCEISAISAPGSKADFSVSILFADKSMAGITFSAKGDTFEGVKEVLNVHRGDVILSMSDFHTLRIVKGHERQKFQGLFRDHGHGANIVNSFEAVRGGDRSKSVSIAQSEATARLFLGVAEAVNKQQRIVLPATAENL
jgi:predicted dehydrogenase